MNKQAAAILTEALNLEEGQRIRIEMPNARVLHSKRQMFYRTKEEMVKSLPNARDIFTVKSEENGKIFLDIYLENRERRWDENIRIVKEDGTSEPIKVSDLLSETFHTDREEAKKTVKISDRVKKQMELDMEGEA